MAADFIIREGKPGDNTKIVRAQDEIARVHRDGRSDLFREEGRHYSDEKFAEILENPDWHVYIAETDGIVAGYAFALFRDIQNHPTYLDRRSLYVDDICVLEAYRRRGIATVLFGKCRELAASLGCRNIELHVYEFNRDAAAFYKAMGMTTLMRRMELTL